MLLRSSNGLYSTAQVLFMGIWVMFAMQLAQFYRNLTSDSINLAAAYQHSLWVFRATFALAVAGFSVLCITVVLAFADVDHLPAYLSRAAPHLREAAYLLFYGGYFGVVHKDAMRLLQHKLRVRRRTQHHHHAPGTSCALCDKPLSIGDSAGDEEENNRPPPPPAMPPHKQLECGHAFHDSCLRGWAVFGKRGSCAHCGERSAKIDTLYDNIPWEKTSLDWLHYLHAVRYLVLYVPCVMLAIRAAWYAITGQWYTAIFDGKVWF